jgi:hypothetical protein
MEAAIAAAKTDRENCETKPNPESIRQMLGLSEPPEHPATSRLPDDGSRSAENRQSTSG